MRGPMKVMLWGALASAAAMGADSPARAGGNAEAGSTLEAVQALSADVYAIGRDADRMRGSTDAQATTLDARIVELRKHVDFLRRASQTDDSDAGALARKLRNVSFVLGNVERARKPGASASPALAVPEHLPRARQSTFAKLDARHGADCGSALGLGVGGEVTGVLDAGKDAWFHVESDPTRTIGIGTRASALDTEIVVFDACPAHGGKPISSSDDAFGLAAAVALQPDAHHGSRWLRVRNLGARGELSVVADETGTIEGTINWVHPLPSSQPNAIALDAEGSYAGTAYSVATHYGFTLAPGNYYVLAFAEGNVGQVWPNVECSTPSFLDCPLESAHTVPVTASATTSGIDFSLNAGAHISGRVREASTGLAVGDARIEVVNETASMSFVTQADSAGRYAVDALPAGSYRVIAASDHYQQQVFDGIDCPTGQACAPNVGTVISLPRQGAFVAANFNLHPAAFVQVVVHTPTAPPFSGVFVTAYDEAGVAVGSSYGIRDQPFDIGPLAPGTYRFAATAQYYMSQLFDHFDCSTDCQAELPSATAVAVVGGASPTLVFDLHALATARGRVTDSVSGNGLSNAALSLWPANGNGPLSVWADVDGTYAIPGVPPGTYWLIASSPDHRDVAYASAPCNDQSPGQISGCQLTSAQLIIVDATDVVGLDFALKASGSISGHVGYATGADNPAGAAFVHLYDAAGGEMRTAYPDASGAYALTDIAAGTYFTQATAYGAFGQIYSGVDCPIIGNPCDATVGTPIVLAQGEQRADIDFSIVDSHRLVGRVVDAASGNGIAGVVIDSWDPSSGLHCDDAPTDLQGYYSLVDSGACTAPTRLLSTDAGLSHVDQVFNGIACPNGPAYSGACSLTGASAVAFPTTPVPTQTDFVLGARDPDLVFATGFDPVVARAARPRR